MIQVINQVLAVALPPSRQPLANLSGRVITRPPGPAEPTETTTPTA
jgi:hypothetical protein